MTTEALKTINARLSEAGINYHFARYNYGGSPVYPYYVGSYSETGDGQEDGSLGAALTISGWTRGDWIDLERGKAVIRGLFPTTGYTAVRERTGLAVTYARSQVIPTGDAELKRIDITLNVKEWSV